MVDPRTQPLYWEMTDSWPDIYDNGKMQRRWRVDKKGVLLDCEQTLFVDVGPVDGWDPETTIECYDKGPVEDIPWAGSTRPIISDRLRQLLEKMAPGHAQYLPVHFALRRKRLNLPPYWLANWLFEVDCHDRERTEFLDELDDQGRRMIGALVVDRSRIPDRVQIFVVKYERYMVLVHDEIRAAIRGAGMTGGHFLSLDYS